MDKGSIVVVKSKFNEDLATCRGREYIKWLPIADESTPYTLRSVQYVDGRVSAYFEEGIFGYRPDGKELGILIEYLRELLPPKSSEELLEEISPEVFEHV